jgi:hypothetical protein
MTMADLVLKGRLDFRGILTLQGAGGGKVKVDDKEVLVELQSPQSHGTAPPVILPPPPVAPLDAGPNVVIVSSFNKTVKAGTKSIVTLGVVLQGATPTWPGMVLPTQGNAGPVSVNQVPMNVQQDQAAIFPSGGTASLSTSGQ